MVLQNETVRRFLFDDGGCGDDELPGSSTFAKFVAAAEMVRLLSVCTLAELRFLSFMPCSF